LNKICTIQLVPGQYPGAKLSFSETLIEHARELLKNDPSYDLSECVKVKVSGDGAKMSPSTNFMIVSLSLLHTKEMGTGP